MSGTATAWSHTTVLLTEAVEALVTTPHGVYVDGTFGRGGHTRALLARLSEQGRVIAFDRDPEAMACGHGLNDPRLTMVHAAFSTLREELAARGLGYNEAQT